MARAIVVVERQSSVSTSLLPFVGVILTLLHCFSREVDALAEFFNSDVEGLALRIEFRYLVLQVLNVLSCALEDSTLVLLGARDNLRNVLDAFVDDFTSSSFNCLDCQLDARYDASAVHTFFVVLFALCVPLRCTYRGFGWSLAWSIISLT